MGIFPMFRRLCFHYFWPFWPLSGSCIFIIVGHFGHIQAAAFFFLVVLAMFRRLHLYYFWPFWPHSGGCSFVIFGAFGHVEGAAFLLFLAV